MDEDSITKNPEYKASLEKLDEAIREHHKVVERIGNERFAEGGTESAFVFGWILGIGIMGTDEDGDEFADVLVDTSQALNGFTAMGMSDYVRGFLHEQTNNFSGGIE